MSSADRPGAEITRRWLIRTSIAVVVSLGLFAAVVFLVLRSDTDESEIVGAARLTWNPETDDPLGEGKSASVEVIRDGDEHRVFVFDLEVLRPPAESEFIETWLVAEQTSDDTGSDAVERVSVGTFDDIRTRLFPLAEGIDPLDFTSVEFSLEADDGDPAYSGRTLMAGEIVWLREPTDTG